MECKYMGRGDCEECGATDEHLFQTDTTARLCCACAFDDADESEHHEPAPTGL